MAAPFRYLIYLCSIILALYRVQALEKTFVLNASYERDPGTVFNETAGINLTLKCTCFSCTELLVLRDDKYFAYFRRYNKQTVNGTVPLYDTRVQFFRESNTYTVVISNLTVNDTGRYFCLSVAYSEVILVNVEEPTTEDEDLRSSTASTEASIPESTAGYTEERTLYQTSSISRDYFESADRLANSTKTSIIENGGESNYPFLKSTSSVITVLQNQDQTSSTSIHPSSTLDLRTGNPQTSDASARSKIDPSSSSEFAPQHSASPYSSSTSTDFESGSGDEYDFSSKASTFTSLATPKGPNQIEDEGLRSSTAGTEPSITESTTGYTEERTVYQTSSTSFDYIEVSVLAEPVAEHASTERLANSTKTSIIEDRGESNYPFLKSTSSMITVLQNQDQTSSTSIHPSSSLDLESVYSEMQDAAVISKTTHLDLQSLASSASVPNPSSSSEFAPQHSASPDSSLTSTDSESGSGDGYENFSLSSATSDRQTTSATKDSKREDSTVLPSSNSRPEDESEDASVKEEDSGEETNPVTTSTESSLLRLVGIIITCVIIMLAVITIVVTKLWMKHQEVNL